MRRSEGFSHRGVRAGLVPAALVLTLAGGLSLVGCLRDDSAATAVDTQSRQQLELLQRQLESLASDLRTASTAADGRGSADIHQLVARLAVLEDRAVRDSDLAKANAALGTLERDMQRLVRSVERQDDAVAAIASLRGQIETLRGELEQRAERQSETRALVRQQGERLEALEKDVLERVTSYLGSLQTGAASPHQAQRIADLEEAMQRMRDENESLQDELRARTRQLERAERTARQLSERLDEMDPRPGRPVTDPRTGSEPSVSTRGDDAPAVPETARAGAFTGRIVQLSASGDVALVDFPRGTPRSDNQRFNVFNDEGVKVATFVVVTDVTDSSDDHVVVRLGGRFERMPGRATPTLNDRVSTLSSLPALPPRERDRDSDGSDDVDDYDETDDAADALENLFPGSRR